MSSSKAYKPPRKYRTKHPPPRPSLSSLPDEIVLRCLARVPRSYHLSLSWVSKHIRSLVRSSEFKGLRSLPHKRSSLYLCFQEDAITSHWFTLRPTEETATTTVGTEYGLVPNPTPFPPHDFGSSTVVVGSNIYFIGGFREPSSDLWILDTQSGNMTQGPSMSVPREDSEAAVGVIGGKIYVIGGGASDYERFHEEIQVEVFDVKSGTWELAGMEKVRKTSRSGASVEGKIYIVEFEEVNVYNPRACERKRLALMVSQRLEKGGRKDMLNDIALCVCVVEDVLYGFFNRTGLMWFNTKLNVWRRLLGPDGKELPFISHAEAMAEYEDGKLVVLYMLDKYENDYAVAKSVRCMLVSLHRAGDMICGTVDWSGVLGTVPSWFDFRHCLAVSD